ncbi:retrotransposable element Tf2 [Tanacetum coccineum]
MTHAGEFSVNRNHCPPVSSEGIFQNYPGNTFRDAGGIFANTTVQPTSTVHGSERGWQPGSDHRLRKLKMPLFDGEDVYGWVYQRGFDGLITARRLLHRFQPSQNGNLLEQFFSISQQGTAREYVTMFEKMAAQLPGLTEEVLGGVFIKGLTPELRTAVRTQQPTTLSQAMDLTMLIDESRTGGTGDQRGGTVPKPVSTRVGGGGIPRPLGGGIIGGGAKDKQSGTSRPPFKRLTETEFADKKAKGLCYRCDEKFLPGHRCPAKTLQLLFIPEGDEGGAEDDQEDEEHFHLDSVEVSAHSVAGINTPHTMKLRGHIWGLEVVVLIDSGATHNFVSLKLVDTLQLEITGKRETGVFLGNGMSEKCYGICRKVELLLPGLRVTEDFYPLELGSTDVILGVKWLRQLGEVRVNWKRLTMTFQNGDNRVTLCGEPGLHRTEASLRSLARGISVNDQGYFVTLANLNGAELPESQVNPALDTLLTEFVDIFSMPIGLPPSRDHEHAIVLKEGTEPINVRPYRYPQLQKDEIEKLVGEMIESGIIRPSTSPFSSPVLLVKKKDGSWRFCVDYRALNKSTLYCGRTSERLWPLCQVLKGRKLSDNRKKCIFGQKQVEYLGHIVSSDGVKANPSKITAMTEWPIPRNLWELRGFLGLTGYYRKFFQGYGKIAKVLTDLLKKDSFKWTDEATAAFRQLQRVMTQIQYRPGRENGATDALLRRREEVELKLTLVTTVGLPDQLLQDLKKDSELEALRLSLETNAKGMEGYSSVDGEIRYRGRLVLPRTSEWIPRIFAEFHGGTMGGHEGTQKTYHRMARELYWVGMRRDVAKLVAECGVCQKNKYSNRSPAGLLQPLELPFRVWEDLTMDFVEGLPKSAGYSVIMVVVDRLSKSAHFIPMKHPFTASSVATVFVREIVRLHGIPCSIISDRDKIFVSHFWREIFKYQGTVMKQSTAYHPQTNGQSEVVNRSLDTYLRCFASERPKEWAKWLPWAEYWYNTSFHSGIGRTPFKVLYDRDPPRLMSYDHDTTVTTEVDQYLWERDRVLAELRA